MQLRNSSAVRFLVQWGTLKMQDWKSLSCRSRTVVERVAAFLASFCFISVNVVF